MKFYYHLLILISSTGLSGAMVYRIYSLNYLGVFLSLLLGIAVYIIQLKLVKFKKNTEYGTTNFSVKSAFFLAIFFISSTAFFYVLATHQSADSLSSPWQVLPPRIFAIFFLMTLSLFLLIFFSKIKSSSIIWLTSLGGLAMLSVAWIVYGIGYGFDPFVHQATLDIIDAKGLVEPKPFYYLGQYAIEIILHKLFFIPLSLIDKILVPVLAALFLPRSIYLFFNEPTANRAALAGVLGIAIVPVSYFMVTTPQHLAFLFLLICVLISHHHHDKKGLSLIFLISLFTALTHPIAGAAALIFAFIMLVDLIKIKNKTKKILLLIMGAASTLSMPTIFYIIKDGVLSISFANIHSSFPQIFTNPTSADWLSNLIYVYIFNLPLLIAIITLLGVYSLAKRNLFNFYYSALAVMTTSGILSYILMTQISLDYLIDYERLDYANRLLGVAMIFAIPFILEILKIFMEKLMSAKLWLKFFIIFCLSCLITISFYATYPRNDDYENSKGFSAGNMDMAAVEWIEENASGVDYIVLANQQVSVMALKKFGFSRYYNNDIYFYPLPTSCQLYKYYLQMVYEKPDQETMNKAMDSAGVQRAYFVLNKYWWAFAKISAEADIFADSKHIIGRDDILIYRYER